MVQDSPIGAGRLEIAPEDKKFNKLDDILHTGTYLNNNTIAFPTQQHIFGSFAED